MSPPSELAPRPALSARLKRHAKAAETLLTDHIAAPAAKAKGRLKRFGPRAPALLGAFPDRASALASRAATRTYDDRQVAEVSFAAMCQVKVWDYPVLYWLNRLHRPGLRVLDAGGHFGTKYIAFRDHLALQEYDWTVYDLPETVAAARARQLEGEVPADLAFICDLGKAVEADLLLASGLLQYLDTPFPAFIASLPAPPRHAILNKVATREGPTVVTLEKIGPARIPYQMRNRAGFEAEIATAGYDIADSWEIPSLSHVIDTHPEFGPSTSRGYALRRA